MYSSVSLRYTCCILGPSLSDSNSQLLWKVSQWHVHVCSVDSHWRWSPWRSIRSAYSKIGGARSSLGSSTALAQMLASARVCPPRSRTVVPRLFPTLPHIHFPSLLYPCKGIHRIPRSYVCDTDARTFANCIVYGTTPLCSMRVIPCCVSRRRICGHGACAMCYGWAFEHRGLRRKAVRQQHIELIQPDLLMRW